MLSNVIMVGNGHGILEGVQEYDDEDSDELIAPSDSKVALESMLAGDADMSHRREQRVFDWFYQLDLPAEEDNSQDDERQDDVRRRRSSDVLNSMGSLGGILPQKNGRIRSFSGKVVKYFKI